MATTPAERTVLVPAEDRTVYVLPKPSSAERTVYASED